MALRIFLTLTLASAQPALRRTQATRPAECLPGYNDVTGGRAFYWSCAFHCEGGPYFATDGCKCACLSREQELRWIEEQRAQATTSIAAPGDAGRVQLTRRQTTTEVPSGPVSKMGIGELGGNSGYQPPSGVYVLPPRDVPPTGKPQPEAKAVNFNLVVVSLMVAGAVVIVGIISLVCFNWKTICLMFKKAEKKHIVEPLPFQFHLPIESCPQPQPAKSGSRLSSKQSLASAETSCGPPTTRPSSKQSALSVATSCTPQIQKDTRSLLKPPVASSTVSTYLGTESLTSWAHRVDCVGNSNERRVQNGSRGSSRNSAASGRRSSNTSIASSKRVRKISKVQPA